LFKTCFHLIENVRVLKSRPIAIDDNSKIKFLAKDESAKGKQQQDQKYFSIHEAKLTKKPWLSHWLIPY